MICPYCRDDIRLVNWANHSQDCVHKKNHPAQMPLAQDLADAQAAGEFSSVEDVKQSIIDGYDFHTNMKLSELSKEKLIEYLEHKEIEHDPKAKKPELLKLAKGE